MNVILFRNRIFADDQVKRKAVGWVLFQYDCVLAKRGNLDTERDAYKGKKK